MVMSWCCLWDTAGPRRSRITLGSSIVEQDNLQMETCHFDPKEDKFLAKKQGCIFEKIKIC
jgi:hypothetical protein